MRTYRHAVLAAILLGTVVSTSAVDVCGQPAPTVAGIAGLSIANTNNLVFAATTAIYSCTCPAGTGEIAAVPAGTNIPTQLGATTAPTAALTTVTYGVTAGSGSTASVVTLTGSATSNTLVPAYIAQLCLDLLPGYNVAASSTTLANAVTPCQAGEYCPGVANLFSGALIANSGITGTVTDLLLASSTALVGLMTLGTGPALGTPCTTGFGIGGVTAISAATGCNSIAPGYSLAAAGTTPAACAAGNYCLGFSAATGAVFAAAGNAVTTGPTAAAGLTPCPTGTTWAGAASASAKDATVCVDLAPGYTILSNIAQASSPPTAVTALTTGITPCAGGFYCPGKTALVSISAGTTGSTFNWAAITAPSAGAATGAPVACTTGFGVGGITAVSAATGCNSIAPGYSLAAAGTTPLACAAGNYCLGFSAATGAVFAAAGNAVTTGPAAAFGLTACPAGTTWAGSASSSATSAAVCDDLAAGYYIRTAIAAQANAGAVTALTTGIQQCPAGYYCAGSLGGIDTANTNGITAGTTGSTFIWDAIPAIAATACTTGTSSVVGATAVSACTLVAPGYYIDHSALNTPATCPAGEYCPVSSITQGCLHLQIHLRLQFKHSQLFHREVAIVQLLTACRQAPSCPPRKPHRDPQAPHTGPPTQSSEDRGPEGRTGGTACRQAPSCPPGKPHGDPQAPQGPQLRALRLGPPAARAGGAHLRPSDPRPSVPPRDPQFRNCRPR